MRIAVLAGIAFVVMWLYDATANRRYLQRVYVPLQEQYDVVAFGDSLIEGIGAEQSYGFISILSDRLGVEILNKGIRRNKTGDLVARMESDVLAFDPKLVIMTGGGNDVIRSVPWEVTRQNLHTLFSRFQSENITVLYLGVQTSKSGDKFQQEMLETVGFYDNVHYIPEFNKTVLFRRELSFDLIHPNNEGHRVVADSLESITRSLLDDLEIPYENK
jgi:acyl-CoA thioesterase-1